MAVPISSFICHGILISILASSPKKTILNHEYGSVEATVKFLVVILTTISWLIIFTTMSSELLDDNTAIFEVVIFPLVEIVIIFEQLTRIAT